MALKDKAPYLFLTLSISIWFVSLLVIALPATYLAKMAFPLNIDANVMAVFLVSAGLSAATALILGLHKLGKLPRTRKTSQTLS